MVQFICQKERKELRWQSGNGLATTSSTMRLTTATKTSGLPVKLTSVNAWVLQKRLTKPSLLWRIAKTLSSRCICLMAGETSSRLRRNKMLISDLIIAVIFTIIAAIALFLNEDKIAAWQEEISKR